MTADRPATEPPLCDEIVNNGFGEPTECGRTLPCAYHRWPYRADRTAQRVPCPCGSHTGEYCDGWAEAAQGGAPHTPQFRPDYATHPGTVLRELLDEQGSTQVELAAACGVSQKHISEIVNGKAGIGPHLAVRLEAVTSVAAEFWCRMQADHDVHLARRPSEPVQERPVCKRFRHDEHCIDEPHG